jgi:hypothetical protein
MDDKRIQELAEEVLGQLRGGKDEASSDLEARVAMLEAAVRRLQSHPPAPAAPATVVVVPSPAPSHPAFGLLGPSAGAGSACVLEPDQPCVGSGQCRSFGH